MALYKRNGIYYIDLKVAGHKRVRRSAKTGNKREAERRESELYREIIAGKDKRSGLASMTLSEAARKALREHWKGQSNYRTAETNALTVVQVLGPQTPINNIGPDAINEFVQQQKEAGLRTGTINRRLSALSKVLKLAHTVWRTDQGEPVVDRLPYIPRLRESRGRNRVLHPDEEQSIMAWLNLNGYEDDAEYFQVLLDTGARRQELLDVRSMDADFENGWLRLFHTKSGEPRSVPLTSRTLAILDKRQDLEYPFGSLSPHRVSKVWRRARIAVGITDADLVLHSLRHTCATRLVNAGVPISDIQLWLGHSTIQVTERYSHLNNDRLKAAVRHLEGRATVTHDVTQPAFSEPVENEKSDEDAGKSGSSRRPGGGIGRRRGLKK